MFSGDLLNKGWNGDVFCHFVQEAPCPLLQTAEVWHGVLTLLKRYTILQAGKSIQLSKDSQSRQKRKNRANTERTESLWLK